MDTLDDFTVMNIIMLCDLKTVLSALPLVCRRTYALYDDVAVIRHFRDDIRAQIVAHAYDPSNDPAITLFDYVIPAMQQQYMSMQARLPLGIIAKANLGDFALVVDVTVSGQNGRSLYRRQIFAPDTTEPLISRKQYMIYTMPCGLLATFETVCAILDARVLNNMLVPAVSVTYNMRDPRGCAQSVDYYRGLSGESTMYALGFGHRYTVLMVNICVDDINFD